MPQTDIPHATVYNGRYSIFGTQSHLLKNKELNPLFLTNDWNVIAHNSKWTNSEFEEENLTAKFTKLTYKLT